MWSEERAYGSQARDLPPPPASFPNPNVPGPASNLPGHMTRYTMPTQVIQPAGNLRHPRSPPSQFPVAHPTGSYASLQPFEAIPHQPRTWHDNDHTRHLDASPHASPITRAPDPAQSAPFPFGSFATLGRQGAPEQPYPPVPPNAGGSSYAGGGQYQWLSPQDSGTPRHQVRQPDYNTPRSVGIYSPFPSPTPQPLPPTPLLSPPHDVNFGHQAHQPHAPTAQPHSPRVGKKALLVGINYSRHRDHRLRLKWGVHDAREIERFLRRHAGFESKNILVLTDDQVDRPQNLPTEANIRVAMRWLVAGAEAGDSLFFYFSGHATQIKDTNGDEPDGFDECMCAMDYENNRGRPTGIIVDDEMHDIMVKRLPRSCRLTAVLDCCHSGTLLDLPFIFDLHGVLKQTRPNVVRLKSSDADVISLSACKDSERAFEAREGGALRKAFIEYMTSSGGPRTCHDIIRSLRAYMDANGFCQRPQLSSCRHINVNQLFII